MRAIFVVVLLLAATPLAVAQDTARPSLTAEPAIRDIVAGGHANVSIFLFNPLDRPTSWTLEAESNVTGAKVVLERTSLVVPARGRERLNATVHVDEPAGVDRRIHVVAREMQRAIDATAANAAPMVLETQFDVRSVPVGIEMRIAPILLDLPANGTARAMLTIRNQGEPIPNARLVFEAPPGVRIVARDPPARILRGETHQVRLEVTHVDANATFDTLPARVLLAGVRAPPAAFRIHLAEPLAAPPSDPNDGAIMADPRTPAPALDPTLMTGAAVIAAVGAGWTALWLTRRQWWPFLLLLYTRLRPSSLLDHPVRKRIVEVVQATPGITFSDLARRVDIAPGQLTHHARMLEKGGVVFSSPDGQTRRFFHVAQGRIPVVAPLAERALSLVQARPMRASDLAKELGVSRQALHYHVKQLVADGKLTARVDGRETWLEAPASPTPGASSLRA